MTYTLRIESFLATLILPFVAFMVADWIDNKDEVAVYSGYMLSAFMFGQLLGSTPWGILSDRIGRRPVLLLGLMGTSASCCTVTKEYAINSFSLTSSLFPSYAS